MSVPQARDGHACVLLTALSAAPSHLCGGRQGGPAQSVCDTSTQPTLALVFSLRSPQKTPIFLILLFVSSDKNSTSDPFPKLQHQLLALVESGL